MKLKRPQINGHYFDNYFWIRLETTKKPEKWLKLNEIVITLIHEYIHFIQNVSTSYGVKNVAQTYSSIAHFYNSKNKTFPFKIFDCNFLTNKNLLATSEKKIDSSNYKIIIKKDNPDLVLTHREIIKTVDLLQDLKLKEYKIHIQRKGKKTETFYLDVTAIEEGMCRIYENHLKEDDPDYYQIPYSLPEIMTRILFPKLLKHMDYIFAICDISLMYTNPPELFVKILKELNAHNYIPNSIPELYNYCYNSLMLEGIPLINIWTTTFNEARNNIINSCNFADIEFAGKWIEKTINFYEQYRLNLPYFLSLPLSLSPKDTLYRMCLLMTLNISPIITNLNNEYCVLSKQPLSLEENNALFHFMEVQSMNEFVFETDGDICTFDRFCKDYATCPYCLTNPLQKPLIDGQVCIFQRNAISYGLKSFFPTN